MNGEAPRIFDPALALTRRRRALREAVPGADFLLSAVTDDLLDRLAGITRAFSLAADIATPTDLLARGLVDGGHVGGVIRLDRLAAGGVDIAAPADLLPLRDASLDLIVSALALQSENDLPGILAQARRALKPDGLLMAAMLGGDTLTELRQSFAAAEAEITGGASPRIAPFTEVRAAGSLLQRAGLALPVVDVDRRIVRYDSALHLMRDLRAMGATNALTDRSRRPLTRNILVRAAGVYAERFSDADGRIRATFDILYLSGWAPAASQPKPLKPGSASVRLADALGTADRGGSGENTGK